MAMPNNRNFWPNAKKKTISDTDKVILEKLENLKTMMEKETKDNLQRYQSLVLKITMLQETTTALLDSYNRTNMTLVEKLLKTAPDSVGNSSVIANSGQGYLQNNLQVVATNHEITSPASPDPKLAEDDNSQGSMLKIVDSDNTSIESGRTSAVNETRNETSSPNIDVVGDNIRFMSEEVNIMTNLNKNLRNETAIAVPTSKVQNVSNNYTSHENETLPNSNQVDCSSQAIVGKSFSLSVNKWWRALIGKNASNIQKIETSSNVQIKIGWPYRPQHLLFISGRQQDIEQALDLIFQKSKVVLKEENTIEFHNHYFHLNPPKNYYEEAWFSLPKSVYDIIENKEGLPFKTISLHHGALIKIGFPSYAFERSLVIQGTLDQIDLAKQLLSAQLEVCLIPYPSYELQNTKDSPNLSENQKYETMDPCLHKIPNKNSYEIEFLLKPNSVTNILGKDGFKIRNYQQLFSVDILIGWSLHANERIVVIRGSPRKIEHAKQAIYYLEVKKLARKFNKFKQAPVYNNAKESFFNTFPRANKRKIESSDEEGSESDVIFEKRVRPEDKAPLAVITLSSSDEAEEEDKKSTKSSDSCTASGSDTETESDI